MRFVWGCWGCVVLCSLTGHSDAPKRPEIHRFLSNTLQVSSVCMGEGRVTTNLETASELFEWKWVKKPVPKNPP